MNKKHIYFIGIGGISMSALAKLCKHQGMKVSGSDLTNSAIIQELKNKKITVYVGEGFCNIDKTVDLVVFTGAISKNNLELVFAKKNNIETLERSQFLAKITKMYKHVISIAGTHGKTTTTAMLAKMLTMADLKPTVHVGGIIPNEGNLIVGKNDYFITEACEYKNSFKYLKSEISVITNIEEEHMDCYSDFAHLKAAFSNFATNSKKCVVFNNCLQGKNIINCNINNKKSFSAEKLKADKNGCYKFIVKHNNILIGNFKLNVPGMFNVHNALLAIAVAVLLKIDVCKIQNAISEFENVLRRSEEIGMFNNVKVIADYAHHPTEIKNCIESFKFKYKRILCVFQPHTYSRTAFLKDKFKSCFVKAKKLIIFKTYAAREKVDKNGTEKVLYDIVLNKNKYIALTCCELINLLNDAKNYNLILFLGAGDIYDMANVVLKSKKVVD